MSDNKTTELDFSDVNWNNLTNAEFRALEVKAQNKFRHTKRKIRMTKKDLPPELVNKYATISLEGLDYLIPIHLAKSYDTLTGEKLRILIIEIKRVYKPVEFL